MSVTSTVVVEPVRTREDYRAFVDLPWQVPLDRPGVRPMREFERHLFDRGKRFRGSLSPSAMIDEMLLGKENPYYEHGDLEMFLARDTSGGSNRPIARIVALENRLHNDYHHDKVGFFGFYQCADGGTAGREATRALVDAASAWLRARGLESIRGPFNPTINDECGIWIEGDSYPSFLMPSNPRYYADHLAAAGFDVAKTLRVYRLIFENDLPETKWARWTKIVDRIERSHPEIKIRTANFKDLSNEVKAFVSIFNQAWSHNWGFAPMSYKELYSMAELFQYMVDPNLIRAAEVVENGVPKVVGVLISVPDLNEFLRHSDGRLLHPQTIWRIIRMKTGQPTNRIRIAILGVLPEYRHTPVSMALLFDSFKVAKKFGAKEIEASWILEDNRPMVQPLEDQNFHITDTYVIYEKAV
jgi:hypothetical protein